jgi:hypothetical protein
MRYPWLRKALWTIAVRLYPASKPAKEPSRYRAKPAKSHFTLRAPSQAELDPKDRTQIVPFGRDHDSQPRDLVAVHSGSACGYHELMTWLTAQRSAATVRRTGSRACISIHRRPRRELTILPLAY